MTGCQELTQTLVESFNALADEVQNLIDRKTILEHKLRYAHEQVGGLFSVVSPCLGPFLPASPEQPATFYDDYL